MAEKIIDKIDQIHERHYDLLDDGAVEVSFYKRMGDRLVQLGNTERWKSLAEATDWYGLG